MPDVIEGDPDISLAASDDEDFVGEAWSAALLSDVDALKLVERSESEEEEAAARLSRVASAEVAVKDVGATVAS